MSTSLIQWTAPERVKSAVISTLPIAAAEGRRHPLMLAVVFTAVALIALILGLLIPKQYTSTTTILVEENGSPSSSSETSASNTNMKPRAPAAREVALSRKVMFDILKTGGWMVDNPDAVTQERLITDIVQRIDIASPRQLPNLVRISYTDTDPSRAFKVTRRLGELVIAESLAIKARESREAYEFIQTQAVQYQKKLEDAQARLSAYQIANPDARHGSEAAAASRIAELRRAVDLASMDMVSARAQAGTISLQLGGENPLGVMQSRNSQFQMRLAQLQAEHERLLLNYTDKHPDVVRVQSQMRELQSSMRQNSGRSPGRLAVASSGVPGATGLNPVYAELKSRLAEARSRSAASASSAALGQGLLSQEMARTERITRAEGTLGTLTRTYEVNRDLYESLLKRRENARVAMNLDMANRGLSLRVQEPATLPVRPDEGLRLMHVAIAGLMLAVAAPVLVLLGWLKLDPRVRTPAQIEQLARLPVLGSIPHSNRGPHRPRTKQHLRVAGALLVVVPIAYVLALILR